jgi:hypothetical protein
MVRKAWKRPLPKTGFSNIFLIGGILLPLNIMIILIPAAILIICGLAIIFLQQTNIKIGYWWFLAVGASLSAAIVTLVFHWRPVLPFILENKGLVQNANLQIALQIDLFSFPYALSLLTLGFVVVLTDLGRIREHESHSATWGVMLIILATGYLAISSISPLMIIFAWTIIDIIEMIFIVQRFEKQKMIQDSIFAFAARIAGTMLVVVAAVYSRSLGQDLNLSHVLPPVGVFLLLAAGLRLGVIPLQLTYGETGSQRGLDTIVRLVGPASSLVLLGRLPVPFILPEWGPWLLFLLSITMLYSSFMWLTAEDEIIGRPYWIITLSAFAIGCAVRSQPSASIGWGIGLILSGGILFLYSSRKIQLIFFPLLGFLGISGLAFTPLASSWQGYFSPNFDGSSFVFIISHMILVVGYLKHAFKSAESYDDLARWAQVLLPVGLLILAIVEWFLGVFGWPGSFSPGNWLLSSLATVLAILIYFGAAHLKERLSILSNQFILRMGKTALSFITSLLSLNWLVRAGLFIYQILQRIVTSLSLILEGEGGILWAMLLLVLVITLARTRGGH